MGTYSFTTTDTEDAGLLWFVAAENDRRNATGLLPPFPDVQSYLQDWLTTMADEHARQANDQLATVARDKFLALSPDQQQQVANILGLPQLAPAIAQPVGVSSPSNP
jgi:hypothetical protein